MGGSYRSSATARRAVSVAIAAVLAGCGDVPGDGDGDCVEGACPPDGDAGVGAGPLVRPVAWWSFERCGGAIADETGSGHDARGPATCTDGRIGQAFDGSAGSAGLVAPAGPRMLATMRLSVTGWLNLGSNAPAQVAIGRAGGWSMSRQGGEIRFTVWLRDGGAGRIERVAATLPEPGWVHAAGVYDGASLRLYLDGELAAQRTATGQLRATAAPVAIGAQFSGQLDELAIYNAALSPAAIAELAARTTVDRDGDGALDDVDVCTDVADPAQADGDGDRLGDTCDPCPLDPDPAAEREACAENACEASCQRFLACVEDGGDVASCAVPCEPGGNPCEIAANATLRHLRVAMRRAGRAVFAHRGSMDLATQNTLEAYRTTIELGGDGNEIDIRQTADGVLVCFHDDMLDHLVEGFGDVSDYTWAELSAMPLRAPGRHGDAARVPTLAEVIDLHRRLDGLLVLDYKQPGLGPETIELLDALDAWDHVTNTEEQTVAAHPRFVAGPALYGLFADHRDVDPTAIAAGVASSAEAFIVDDPRGLVLALGRPPRPITAAPYGVPRGRAPRATEPAPAAELAAILADPTDSAVLAPDPAARDRVAAAITGRAIAAHELSRALAAGDAGDGAAALRDRVAARSLHQSWRYMGLDGGASLRALAAGADPEALALARMVVFRIDPVLSDVRAAIAAINPDDPYVTLPPSWLDWREKWIVWTALRDHPDRAAVAALAREFLQLDPAALDMYGYGVHVTDSAARLLIEVDPSSAATLLTDPRPLVRGRAVLTVLEHADEGWARAALEQHAPYAIPWIVTYR